MVVGVIISALVFAWEHAKHTLVTREQNNNGSTIYHVNGPLFFGSTTEFLEQFTPKDDENDVIIDFAQSKVFVESFRSKENTFSCAVHL